MNGKWRKGKGRSRNAADEPALGRRRDKAIAAQRIRAGTAGSAARIISPVRSRVARSGTQQVQLAAHHPAQVTRPAGRWIHPPRMVRPAMGAGVLLGIGRHCAALQSLLATAKATSRTHEKASGYDNEALEDYIEAAQERAGSPR